MTPYDWEHLFTSLDFIQGAVIPKAVIDKNSPAGLPATHLYACTPAGERLPIHLYDEGTSWGFSLGGLQSPITHMVFQDEEKNEMLRIDGLMPRSDKEYDQNFRSNKNRPRSPYVNFFIARQMVFHFSGSVSYRIAAAVVAIYKAIEVREPQYLAGAEEALKLADQLIPQAPIARSPRRNREHLRLSLWCAEWHFHLFRDDPRSFLDCLNKVYKHTESEALSTYFNLAYPANTTLCILCLYLTASGKNDEALKVAKLSVSLFKRSVRDADTNLAHFKELSKIHWLSYECLEIIKGDKPITEKKAKSVFEGAIRVGSAHDASVQPMWRTLKNCMKL